MRTAGWAVLGLLGVTSVAAGARELFFFGAAPTTPPMVADGPPDAETARLIADLGAPDYRTREKAGQALERKGDAVLPALRRAMTATDSPEAARRLAVLIRRMDYDRLVAPKRVTLTVTDATPKAVFEEIAKQTGYRIEFGGNGEGRYSFAFDKTPFWQAVDKVADAAGLVVQANSDDETVYVNSYNRSRNPYVCYAGPFRFVANQISSNRSVQLAGIDPSTPARGHENIGLSFQVQSEPKNPILGTLQPELVSATDETGASLLPPRNPNTYYSRSHYGNPGYRTYNTYGNVNLFRAGRDATLVKSLKGKMAVVLLAGAVPEVEVADPLMTKAKTVTGRTVEVTFDSMTAANNQYTASLTVKRLGNDNPNQVDYNWANSVWQKVEVADAAGNRYRTYGPQNTNHNGTSVQMTIAYTATDRRGQPLKLGPPARLIVNEWLSVTHEVTFEFKDIPLP